MESYEIHLSDVHRILFGDVPPWFFLEVVIRTAVIYLVIMVSMRAMGKRMSSQLSRNELAAIVSLAAAIGVPIQAPDRGLLPVIIIAVIIVIFQRIIARRSAKSERFERITQDDLSILVQDSRMNLDEMRKTLISRERLFAQLRSESVTHLGMVDRLYMEANGGFSIRMREDPRPGLCILPYWDTDFRESLRVEPDAQACYHCGYLRTPDGRTARCPVCNRTKWVAAVH